MRSYLEKALNLAKKTGDRVIVVDQERPENCYVVMNFDEYERLVDDFEVDFEDNFNWDPESDDFTDIRQDFTEDSEFFDDEKGYDDAGDFDFSEKLDNYKDYGKINNDFFEFDEEEKSPKKRWEIPEDIKQTGQEEMPEFGNEPPANEEDRYYLETI